MKENELGYDCPHCGHLLKITIDVEKGEDTLE
jgi:DNA-directed RNA polymerase subunit RPC12/RpoP